MKENKASFVNQMSKKDDLGQKLTKKKEKNLLTVVNVYAPTSKRAADNSNELEDVYSDLAKVLEETKKESSLTLIGGDFNAKVGKRENGEEECLGRYSRGRRNESGQKLIDFCSMHNLCISNSSFKHPARHITTWHSKRTQNGITANIYNQIYYIICTFDRKQLLRNARSHNETLLESDHRVVVAEFELDLFKMFKPQRNPSEKPFNSCLLTCNVQKREEYKNQLDERLNQLRGRGNAEWNEIRTSITETAKEVIGYRKNDKNKKPENEEVAKLSKKQKELRLEIAECNDPVKVQSLKARRNKLLHSIKTTLLNNKEKELDEKVSEINLLEDSAKMFKSVREPTRKKFENAFVLDKNRKKVTNPQEMYNIIKGHFQQQFFDNTEVYLKPFIGNPRKLNNEITLLQVTKAVKKLNNSRAPGFDMISAEMVKYGPAVLLELIT